MSEQQRELVFQQLIRKDKLAKELKAEKVRLETMKKELQSLSEAMKREQRLRDSLDGSISPEVKKWINYLFITIIVIIIKNKNNFSDVQEKNWKWYLSTSRRV